MHLNISTHRHLLAQYPYMSIISTCKYHRIFVDGFVLWIKFVGGSVGLIIFFDLKNVFQQESNFYKLKNFLRYQIFCTVPPQKVSTLSKNYTNILLIGRATTTCCMYSRNCQFYSQNDSVSMLHWLNQQ